MNLHPKHWFRRETLGKDISAGVVLGIESVPDGLAAGVLAGVNPLAGLYGYLFGMVGAALFTSSTFMAVQATGAMALVVGDANLSSRDDPDAALYTLAIMTGVVMILAGLLRLGRLVRFVPTAVMTGFITAVGINIVLGQLSNLTGYDAQGANRIIKLVDVIANIGQWSMSAFVVGVFTIAGIVVLQRTKLGSLGLVLAVVLGSGLAALLMLLPNQSVPLLSDIVDVPSGLPTPVLPTISDMLYVALPAVSLAFVGLIQGAGVSAGVPTADGKPADASQDFIGQGVGNILAGLFRGMPVGGSMSASALIVAAGAKTRFALLVAGGVMAIVIVAGSQLVAYAAMPALAGLLIVVGFGSIKPSRVYSVWRTGAVQTSIMLVTFIGTLIIPLQFAVLMGVGLGIVMFVVQQSNRIRVVAVQLVENRMKETAPPKTLPGNQVTILQPYGSLFFASAPGFEQQLPDVTPESENAQVVLRLRGTDQLGLALFDVLKRYASDLAKVGGQLRLVVSNNAIIEQLEREAMDTHPGVAKIYHGSEWIGEQLRVASADASQELDPTEEP